MRPVVKLTPGAYTMSDGSSIDVRNSYNDYQDTGVKKLTSSIKNTFFEDASVQKKFRTWKAQLPRANKMQRLRDSWTAIELGFNEIPTDNTRPDTNFNFMLYNIAYSELYFTSTCFPDFDNDDFDKSLLEYQNRKITKGGNSKK